ncbi:MAG: hypothetical protein C4516_08180 [Oxalobacter sp.]|nr:MAG: hypothetical protein C4516_08180 [Oxalobacter sp.]
MQINEVGSHDYAVRAKLNAQSGDVTLAMSLDFNTPREKIVKEVAGKRYMGALLTSDAIKTSRLLLRKLRADGAKTLNVTGNSISTLVIHNLTQEKANEQVYAVLSPVHKLYPIRKIFSGGSSGVDLAAAVCGMVLGIETVVTTPTDLKQVTIDQIQYGAGQLKKHLRTTEAA